jgi:protein phosphatase
MGTTLTALWVDADSVLIAQVGDSRAYLLRDGDLIRCTHDHSLVEELVSKSVITPEQARYHPDRSVITRALGIRESVLVDLFEWDRKKGDIWLICSDGLTDMVDDSRLKIYLNTNDADDAADMLLSSALVSGGTDNITFIILDDDDGVLL